MTVSRHQRFDGIGKSQPGCDDDGLSALLGSVSIRTIDSRLMQLTGSSGVGLPQAEYALVAAIDGVVCVESDQGQAEYSLRPGELALFNSSQLMVRCKDAQSANGDELTLCAQSLDEIGSASQSPQSTLMYIGLEVNSLFSDMIGQCTGKPIFGNAVEVPSVFIESQLALLCSALADKRPGNRAETDIIIRGLVVHLLRISFICNPDHLSGVIRAAMDENIGPVVLMIHQDISLPLGLEDLADRAGLSRTVFIERFRNIMDMTPGAYIRKHRMCEAAELVLDTDLGVSSIAYKIGYQSSGAFCTAFKKSFGMTPGEYRKQREIRRAPPERINEDAYVHA